MNKEFQKRDIKSTVEIREEVEGKRTITGFIPYNSRSQFLSYFYEYIEPTAFNKTLRDGYDVKALVDHDTSKVLGRVKNGSLRLESREDGLYAECDLPNTTYANDVYELIKNGYCNTMSFGFRIIEQDYTTDEVGIEVHKLREVALQEISWGVSFPAYEATDSTARSIRGINIAQLNTILEKEELSDNDKTHLQETINAIRSILEPVEETPEAETTEAVDKDTSAEDEERDFINKIREDLRAIIS